MTVERILRLSSDEPNELFAGDVFMLEAAMLAPDEPGLQDLFVVASDQREKGNADPLNWLKAKADLRQSFEHGFLAGHAVELVLAAPEGLSIRKAVEPLIARIASTSIFEAAHRRVSVDHFFKRIWPKYEPVAHYWAAYCERCAELGGSPPFPCSVADLPGFLGLSEWYGSAASTKKSTARATAPILDLDKCIRPAAPLRARLPAVTVLFFDD